MFYLILFWSYCDVAEAELRSDVVQQCINRRPIVIVFFVVVQYMYLQYRVVAAANVAHIVTTYIDLFKKSVVGIGSYLLYYKFELIFTTKDTNWF